MSPSIPNNFLRPQCWPSNRYLGMALSNALAVEIGSEKVGMLGRRVSLLHYSRGEPTCKSDVNRGGGQRFRCSNVPFTSGIMGGIEFWGGIVGGTQTLNL